MKNQKMLSLTNGQHILYGVVCSYLVEEFNYDPTVEDCIKMMELIIELDSPENYDTELTPSEGMEQNLENIKEIFDDFWEENEQYILELASETNSNIKEIL
jgi:hypothetical protein